MRLQSTCWLVLATGGLLSPTAARSDEWQVPWSIGSGDRSAAEFALGPASWREFHSRFPDDTAFVVGQSDPHQDWPYVHPGPADAWAGARPHAFVVLFGLNAAGQQDGRLVIELVETHPQSPPKWQIDINGHTVEVQMPVGAAFDSVDGKPETGRPHRCEVPVPAAALRAGNNMLTIRSLAGSWCIYDALRFELPAPAETAPVMPQTVILSTRTPGVLLRRDGDSPAQPIELAILHTGEPRPVSVLAGGSATPAVLQHGLQALTLSVPPVDKPAQVNVTVEADGQTLAEAQVELKPVRPWVVYLLPHSHNDIGYTHVQTEVEKKQWEYLDLAIATARQTAAYPDGARFRWNVEVMWAVDSYLRQAAPEKQQAFIDAVKAGWVELDALYGNELTALCRPEELIRLVECAARVAARCGVPLESAMISDVPGYTWGIVPVLAQAGVKYFSVGPNPGDRIGGTLSQWGDKPFYWQSPSGQERILCWVAGKGYALFHGASLGKMGVEPLLAYLEQLDQGGYPYDLVQVRYSVGGDNGPPDPAMCDYIREWNQAHVYPRLAISTTAEMCHAFEARYGDRLPLVRGDFTPYWEDGAASSARETGINRRSAEKLVQAEALFALLGPDKYPADDFYTAWRNVLLYDEHTWGAYNSISEPDAQFVKDQWTIKQAFALDGQTQSSGLLNAALELRGAPDTGMSSIDVINTTAWSRTDWVFAPQGFERTGAVVKKANGTIVPSQKLSDGSLVFLAEDVPPLAAQRYTVTAGNSSDGGRAKADGTTLTNGNLTVRIDPKTGAIASLRLTGIGPDLVDAQAAVALNDYIYLPGGNVKDAQRNGPVKVSVKEAGPFWASLLVESDAPGCSHLTREIIVREGIDEVCIINTVDKQAVRTKEGVHFGFGFNVPAGVVRMETPFAVVRPEQDQLVGACRNWFTVQRWVDISNDDYGVTWATLEAPLVEIGGLTANLPGSQPRPDCFLSTIAPSQTIYSWVMNNHWHTNYKADQDGPTTFCYVIRPHRAYVSDEAARFGVGCSQRLIAFPAPRDPAATAALSQPRLCVSPPGVLISSLKPSADGQALLVRLFNSTDRPASTKLEWGTPPPRAVYRSTSSETAGEEVHGPIELPAWGIATLRCVQ